MYYLCTSEEERALKTGLSPLFLPNIRDEIQEAVSKVTDTASFLGYYSNVTLMEGFYAAIL